MQPEVHDRRANLVSNSVGLPARQRDEGVRLMSLVERAHRHLTDNLAYELEQSVGIPPIFFEVLAQIAAAPTGRLTMTRLSEEVAVTKSGITRLIDRMVGAGLVVRQNSSSDRRRVHIVLTAAGRDILRRATVTHVEAIDRHLVAPLSDEDRSLLTATLNKVLGQNASRDGVPPGVHRLRQTV